LDEWSSRYPSHEASEGINTVSLAVFQSIGPTELIIVLVIVLVIFGPKRLPGLGRQLGSGMREFKDSLTGKDKDDEEEQEQAAIVTTTTTVESQPAAAPAPKAEQPTSTS